MAQLTNRTKIGRMGTTTDNLDLDGIGKALGVFNDSDAEALTTSLVQPLTVSEVAERIGLSVHTLRWYERIGLVEQVHRDTSGYRRYTADDIGWLLLLLRLRATGMPVRDMLRYAELARSEEDTAVERRELLERHRERVAAHIAELHRHLTVIDRKVAAYRAQDPAHEARAS